MTRSSPRFVIAIGGVLLLSCQSTNGRSDELPNGGKIHVFSKSDSIKTDHLIVHFHGAADTVKAAFDRSHLTGVLVVVNFPGLSSAYSQPFAKDDKLFLDILCYEPQTVGGEGIEERAQWKRVTLSSFSAGYGAIREILKTEEYFDRVNDIVAVDSIYAGLQDAKQETRQVDERNMEHFLEFARKASEGERSFIISHSAQPTPYASTTETANYLLSRLKVERKRGAPIQEDALTQRSYAKRGQFSVLGFDGTTGEQHLQHLRHIDRFWNQMPRANVAGK